MTTFKGVQIDSPTTGFQSVLVSQKTPIFQPINSILRTSELRDVQTTTGSATITTSDGEFVLSTGTTTGSEASLRTTERGRYVAGQQAEMGIGVRVTESDFTGTAEAIWGYYDDDNGLGFGVDATGIFTFIRRATVDTKTYQSNWNVDTLDGNGRSGVELDTSNGNTYQIDFTWYGYGPIEYDIVITDGNDKNEQKVVAANRAASPSQASIPNPNLPVSATITNGDTTDDLTIYVTGRQFSIFGEYNPTTRFTSQYRLLQGSIGTTFLPTVSFRAKTGDEIITSRVGGLDIIADADLLYQVRLNGTLTGASWQTPTDYTANETSLESDNSATAVSGGDVLFQGLFADAQGSGQGSVSLSSLPIAIPVNEPVTVCVRRISGSNATASTVFRMIEEW